MPDLTDLVGIGLAGGQGVRARPLTLKAPGYLRSKAAMSFLGRRLIRWVLQILSSEGIKDYYIIAHGKENRYQIKVMIGYGEGFGVDVKYSPVKYDALSKGSADSALRMMDYWDITQRALVFPTDTIIAALYTLATRDILDKPALIAYAQPALAAGSGFPYLLSPTGLGRLLEVERSVSCRVSSRSAERRCGSTSTGSSVGA